MFSNNYTVSKFYAIVENGFVGLYIYMTHDLYRFIAFSAFCLLFNAALAYGSSVSACESQNVDSSSSTHQMTEVKQSVDY